MSPGALPAGPVPSAGLHALWAKTDPTSGSRHPLLWHLLDVAAVAEALWDDYASAAFRRQATAAFGLDDEEQGRAWFAWFAAMHDLGKVSPHFQCQGGVWAEHAEAAGMRCVGETRVVGHEPLGAATLTALLRAEGAPVGAARAWAQAVSVEHGEVLDATAVRDAAPRARHSRYPEYPPVQAETSALVRAAVGATTPLSLAEAPPAVVLVEVAGLVKAADWLGSHPGMFPHHDHPEGVHAYLARARRFAGRAVRANHLTAWRPPAVAPTFTEQFGIAEPRPLQETVISRAREAGLGTLLLVEAQMGQGKTEAALGAAMEFAVHGATGLYFALPTQATARAMHERVGRWLARTGLSPDPILNSGAWRTLTAQDGAADAADGTGDFEHPDVEGGRDRRVLTEPSRWFRGPHRALLAKVGVGTVDQVLLAAEPTRYNTSRHAGLAGRVVVFDEVHAYDTFMGAVFATALRWLAALGCPVVLLSATLPPSARAQFVNAYRSGLLGHPVDDVLPEAGYPAVTEATAAGVRVLPVEAPPSSRMAVEHLVVGDDPATDLASVVAARVGESTEGTVAVVCNSVDRAIDTARALTLLVPQAEVTLFHARFTAADRERITGQVLADFGAAGLDRRGQALRVVVATQVIEQSLDIDVDWMITEIAPVDLVLQRSGRLHRWAHTPRPPWGGQASLLVAEPPLDVAGDPKVKATSAVYAATAPATLLASWHRLRSRDHVNLPDDIPALVQAAYDDLPALHVPVSDSTWGDVLTAQRALTDTAGLRGGNVSLPSPWGAGAWPLPSDGEPDVEGRRLRSRDGEEAMPVALARRTPEGLQPVSADQPTPLDGDPLVWLGSTVNVRPYRHTQMAPSSPWPAGLLQHVDLVILDDTPTAAYSPAEGLTFP